MTHLARFYGTTRPRSIAPARQPQLDEALPEAGNASASAGGAPAGQTAAEAATSRIISRLETLVNGRRLQPHDGGRGHGRDQARGRGRGAGLNLVLERTRAKARKVRSGRLVDMLKAPPLPADWEHALADATCRRAIGTGGRPFVC